MFGKITWKEAVGSIRRGRKQGDERGDRCRNTAEMLRGLAPAGALSRRWAHPSHMVEGEPAELPPNWVWA